MPPRHLDSLVWVKDSIDSQRYQIFPQEEDRAHVGGEKRKLPSPEGTVRQAALPQPQTGRERRGLDEEEEEQQQRLIRQGRVVQNSESRVPQEWQEEGQLPEGQKSRNISAGKESRNDSEITSCFLVILQNNFLFIIYIFKFCLKRLL